jgi:hypothetical protein
MSGYRQYEKDETLALRRLIEQMNLLHANMGGRDRRPERVALMKCMFILEKEIERARLAQIASAHPAVSPDSMGIETPRG